MAKINETNYPRRQASEYASTDMFIVQPVPDPEQEHSGDSRTTRVSDLKDYILGDADPSKIGTPAAGTYTSASNTNAQNIAALDHALANYDHLTKQIATQSEINGYIADPTTADFNVIYLLKDTSATGSDKYFEYMRLGTPESSTFEMTGDTSTDLSNYFTKAEINAALAEKMDVVNNKGSATKGVYFDANGAVQEMTYTVEKSVPSDAVFTDTKNTAGSTDSSSKLFLIGATSQVANPQTYSQDTAYVGTDGNLYSGSKVVATQNMIGDAWVSGHDYAVGDYSIDANGLYRNGTAHTSTATNRPSVNQSGYWTAVSVASQLKIGSTLVLDTSKEFIFKSGSGVQSLGNFILKQNSYSSTDSITVDTNKIRIICNRRDNGVQSPYGCFTNSFNSSLYLALVIEGQPISGYTWNNNNVFGSVLDSNTTYNNGHLGAAVQKDNSTFFMIYNLASFTGNKYLWLGSAGGRSYDLINAYLIKK